MNSRVINSPTLNFDKKIKPLTIKTSSDVLSIKNMTKHKSQEAYIQKSISKDKIKNKQLIIENKKSSNQLSPKSNKNKQALSPRILSPNMGTKKKSTKNSKNEKNEKKNTNNNNNDNIKNNKIKHNSKHSLDKIMSDGDSCQDIESDEDEEISNGRKKSFSTDSEIIDEREFDFSSPITEKLQKYNEIKYEKLSTNPFMMNSNKEKSININKEISTLNNISIDINNCNFNIKNNENYSLYIKLLNLAKKGDRELFLEYLEKILNLPNNLGDINFRDENGFSALHYSCDEGNLKIVEILLKANCDCNIRTNDKKTPLHFTASRGYFDISKLLIENGAVLNVYDNEKNTPLHYSSLNGHFELIKYFLGKLPQADTQNIYGKTPLDIAKKEEIKNCLKIYIENKDNMYHKIKIHNTTETTVKNLMRNFSPKQDNNIDKNNNNNKELIQKKQNNIHINIQTSINNSSNNSNKISNINTEANENSSKMKKNNGSKNNLINSSNKLLKNNTTNNSITAKSKSKAKKKNNNNINNYETNNRKNNNKLSTSTKKKPSTANSNISKKNSLSNFSLHSQFSNRKKTSNKILNSSEKNIPNGNLHKTKTLQKFTINNPFIKGLKSNKTLSNKKNSIPGSEKKQNITNNSINITSTSIDTSISHLNKTDDNSNIKNGKIKSTEEENCLDSIEEERITPSSFICLALLGKGSFGEVYLVQKINTGSLYAMKVLSKDRIMGQNLLKYAMAERNVLSLSNHPFIVKLNFAFQTLSKLFLILDYCPGGDLSKHLYHEKRFIEPRAKFYICEILLALEDLHKRDIIFRDLKPDNVVLDSDGHCKLTDFGLSKEGVFDSNCAKSFCGSIAYLAPEMLKKEGHGKAVDWYLLGVLLYEMLIGIPPFFTEKREEIFYNIEYGELQIPKFISKNASCLLRDLLQKDPLKRLGGGIRDALEIKEHEYFKGVNWDDVYNKKVIPPKIKKYSKMLQTYNRPRLFANDDNYDVYNTEGNEIYCNNPLPGWSFINNDEI